MDPNNYRIHKRPKPEYRPRAIVRPSRPVTKPIVDKQSRSVVAPVTKSMPSGLNNRPRPGAAKSVSRPTQAVYPKQPSITVRTTPVARQKFPQAGYVFNDSPEAQAVSHTKPSKKVLSKRNVIILILILLLIAGGIGGYYYYKRTPEPVQAAKDKTTEVIGVQTVDFTLYKTKEGSLFTSEDTFSEGKEQTKILVANSSSRLDNRQVVLSQQKVDKYFTSDPNGLDKLLQSVGSNSAMPTEDGMSYIVEGGTTALSIKGETLIIVRSTGELSDKEWVELFNSLESIN